MGDGEAVIERSFDNSLPRRDIDCTSVQSYLGHCFSSVEYAADVLRIGANIRIVLATFALPMILDVHIAPFPPKAIPRFIRRGLPFLCLVLVATTSMGQSIPNKFVLGSVGYAMPQGALADRLFELPPTVGLSIGYLFAPSRTLLIGASGSWMHFSSDVQFDLTDSAGVPDTETTALQMMALARLRLLKHGLTPYIDLEAGMCYLSHADQTRPCFASAIGLQIPVSDVVDIDLRFRTSWAPMANDELLIHGVHAGLVYALPR